ncbi:lysoplasmalogenase family protein [Sphingomonas sp.]|uniref:lysoplasmalogenase family protein n=1 Tax=Sphingomonas sp. TaxID=28214 RepID=UPI0025D9AB5F|nr:lysoplasmalogenase family protein [Sphingomonas sp.]
MARGLILMAALLAGASYFVADRVMPAGPLLTVWKGAGVGLLALWAAARARGAHGWWLAAVLALGALGDVLIEAAGLVPGALAFLAGHVAAAALYLRYPRPTLTPSQRVLVWLMVPAVAFSGWALAPAGLLSWGIALYAAGLGTMAATAWASAFPRYWVGLGAVAFVASDLLLFARLGVLSGSAIPGLLVWPLYFGGQAMIAWGAVRYLAR